MKGISIILYVEPKKEIVGDFGMLCLDHHCLSKNKTKALIFTYYPAFNEFATNTTIENRIKRDLNKEGYRLGRDFDFIK